MVVLKNKPNAVASQISEFGVIERGSFYAFDAQAARGGSVQQADGVEQGTFARA
jgi:hypothetical protein